MQTLLKTGALALILAGVVLVSGCPNPADNTAKANVGNAKEENKPAAGTTGAELKFSNDGSKLEFTGSKVTGKHDGGFKKFDGVITLDKENKSIVGVTVEIDVTSVWTDNFDSPNERLTGHLKSPDFFDAEKNPKGKFVSTKITKDGDKYKVEGNLTLRGETKGIEFPATLNVNDKEATAKAEFHINRKDFKMAYAGKADDLIRDEVVIRFDVAAKR